MKKLFEAVQKQKANENSSNEKRTRKGTAPVPKTMNSSQTYAGAAFDRAPAATSFPIPSFIKTSASENGACGPALSSSCPTNLNFNITVNRNYSKSMDTSNNQNSKNNLKALSVTDLFKTFNAQSEEEENEVIKPDEKKKLQSLTNDLRKLLNLR